MKHISFVIICIITFSTTAQMSRETAVRQITDNLGSLKTEDGSPVSVAIDDGYLELTMEDDDPIYIPLDQIKYKEYDKCGDQSIGFRYFTYQRLYGSSSQFLRFVNDESTPCFKLKMPENKIPIIEAVKALHKMNHNAGYKSARKDVDDLADNITQILYGNMNIQYMSTSYDSSSSDKILNFHAISYSGENSLIWSIPIEKIRYINLKEVNNKHRIEIISNEGQNVRLKYTMTGKVANKQGNAFANFSSRREGFEFLIAMEKLRYFKNEIK